MSVSTALQRSVRRNPRRYIRRIESRKGRGFQVVLNRPKHTKMFSVSVYGEQRAAYRAAKKHRDAVVNRVPIEILVAHTSDSRSKTGVVGVS